MIYLADPSFQPMQRAIMESGIGSAEITEKRHAVARYLAQYRKRKDKARVLCPICMDIIEHEVKSLGWGDECFLEFCRRMFTGADVSQLDNFYSRYSRSRNKTMFFLGYVRHEL